MCQHLRSNYMEAKCRSNMSSFWFCSGLNTTASVQYRKVFVPAPVHTLINAAVQKAGDYPQQARQVSSFTLEDPVLRSRSSRSSMVPHTITASQWLDVHCNIAGRQQRDLNSQIGRVFQERVPRILPRTLHHSGGAGSVVANHSCGGEILVAITTLILNTNTS